VKSQQFGRRLSQLWLAVRVGVWLCALPIRLHLHTLPGLLERLTFTRARSPCDHPVELERTVGIVRRVCQLRCFRGRLFPQACLRQALALYAVLARLGYPVEIHFGVFKPEGTLRGHSWVTVGGVPIEERRRPGVLTRVYSYPAATDGCRRKRPVEDEWTHAQQQGSP
jgi:Transglutaminase-like superfamily